MFILNLENLCYVGHKAAFEQEFEYCKVRGQKALSSKVVIVQNHKPVTGRDFMLPVVTKLELRRGAVRADTWWLQRSFQKPCNVPNEHRLIIFQCYRSQVIRKKRHPFVLSLDTLPKSNALVVFNSIRRACTLYVSSAGFVKP